LTTVAHYTSFIITVVGMVPAGSPARRYNVDLVQQTTQPDQRQIKADPAELQMQSTDIGDADAECGA
jgi:hypothetical protein